MPTKVHAVIGYGFEQVSHDNHIRFNDHVWTDEFMIKTPPSLDKM
jgi:hypothetical protein